MARLARGEVGVVEVEVAYQGAVVERGAIGRGGPSPDERAGTAGIELTLDDSLHGIEGRIMVSVDAKRRWVSRVEKEPEAGENLVKTAEFDEEKRVVPAVMAGHEMCVAPVFP